MEKISQVTVVGSINMDLITTCTRIPEQGETIIGDDFETAPGGKGANQAVAAARLGAEVNFIGRTGEDYIGRELRAHLKESGISGLYVEEVPAVSTGTASILLTEKDNRIIIAPGANAYVTPDYIDKHLHVLKKSDIVLMSFEIPAQTILHTAKRCSEYNLPLMINPAPALHMSEMLWELADFITPNEKEYNQLFIKAEESIQQKIITTLGDKGAQWKEEMTVESHPGYKSRVQDTTGAGDTFNGALAVSKAAGKTMKEAVAFANAAASIAVEKMGAQTGMPDYDEVQKRMNEGLHY